MASIDTALTDDSDEIAPWDNKYATGIEKIDSQHKTLFALTNDLYRACLAGDTVTDVVFKETLRKMVDYVRFHFSDELTLLKKVNYPGFNEQKAQHDGFVKQILEAVKDYEEGKKFVANSFVRDMRDWILGHIGYSDKKYAIYIADLKKKGLITAQQINF